MNRFIYFRKKIKIEGQVHQAQTLVSADGRYQLFVNGRFIGRGPTRCHPRWQNVDSYDLTQHLNTGNNIIAVLVHTYGRHTSWYELPEGLHALYFGPGGLFFQGEIQEDRRIFIDSDGSWKSLISAAWEQEVPFSGTGYSEVFHAEEEPDFWKEEAFDDSLWQNAFVLREPFILGGNDVIPFPNMVLRSIPQLKETVVYPVEIVCAGEVPTGKEKDLLSQFRAEQMDVGVESVRGMSGYSFSTCDGMTQIAVFDFGNIMIGRLILEVETDPACEIDFTFGETLNSNSQVFVPPEEPGIAAPLIHRIYPRKGITAFEQFETHGLRYVELHIRKAKDPVQIRQIGVRCTSYPSKNSGSFLCSDECLTTIWEAGIYTVHVCKQDGLIDCPSREQRQWLGDVYIHALVNFVYSADTSLVRNYLLQAMQTQRSDGMLSAATTCDLRAEEKIYIPDFCLLWILTAGQYFDYTGDESCIRTLYPGIVSAVGWFQNYINRDSLLTDVPGWILIDWSTELDRKGQVTVLNALFIKALQILSDFSVRLGMAAEGEQYYKLAEDVISAINTSLWDEGRGVYADARREGSLSRVISQQANSVVICFGIAPEGRRERIFSYITDKQRIKLTQNWNWDRERPFDPDHDVILAQPFYSNFLHAALYRAGKIDEIIENIKLRWEPMCRTGRTFWESWQITDITSRCHGFSSTPSYDLSTYILGVRPLEPGFKRFLIAPYIGEMESAKGVVPTPHGPISVEWEQDKEMLKIDIEVPVSLEADLHIPKGYQSEEQLHLTGGKYQINARKIEE